MSLFECELSKILDKESALLTNLEECAEQKSDILASGDIEALAKLVEKEQPMAMQCKNLETKRSDLLRKNKMSGKTLREICAAAEPQTKTILESQLNTLTEVTTKLKQRNDLNSELTKSRLEFYGKMRTVLTKPVYGYNKEPDNSTETNTSLIDRMI